MNLLPKARTKNITVQNLEGELLIYNKSTNQAFCLNHTCAVVFNACNGETSFLELQHKAKLTDDLIYLALDTLKKENLLDESAKYVSPFAVMTRREAIRKVGLASLIALPTISTLVAPQAAHAASGVTCNSCTASFPLGTVTQFPAPVGPGIAGVTISGCVSGCTSCRCTIQGGTSSCTSTCTVN